MKKALILAAGIGKRLGDLTKDIPKCLLPLDSSGSTLIDYSLETLMENNIKEVTIVSGFADKKLREYLFGKWEKKINLNFIFNEKFSEYNNVYSAYLAKDIWDDTTVLLNSDIIFHAEILKNLKSKIENESKSFLVIDSSEELVDEDMKVETNPNSEIKKISKNLNNKTSFGEYIGIAYLRGKERVKFLESLELNIKNKKLNIYYEDALADVLNEVSVYPSSTLGKPWTEVDTKEDYELAKKIAKQLKKATVS